MWRTLVRIVAMCLLLGAGLDMASDMRAATVSSSSRSTSQTQDGNGVPCPDTASTHGCFCCCTHATVASTVKVMVTFQVSQSNEAQRPSEPSAEVALPFHPPKA